MDRVHRATTDQTGVCLFTDMRIYCLTGLSFIPLRPWVDWVLMAFSRDFLWPILEPGPPKCDVDFGRPWDHNGHLRVVQRATRISNNGTCVLNLSWTLHLSNTEVVMPIRGLTAVRQCHGSTPQTTRSMVAVSSRTIDGIKKLRKRFYINYLDVSGKQKLWCIGVNIKKTQVSREANW